VGGKKASSGKRKKKEKARVGPRSPDRTLECDLRGKGTQVEKSSPHKSPDLLKSRQTRTVAKGKKNKRGLTGGKLEKPSSCP